MAIRQGTTIISPIRIQDDTIPNPVAYVNELQGGAQSGTTKANRDAVPVYLRQWGMFFTVYNDGSNNGTYQLVYNNIDTDITNNANWKLFAAQGGSNVTMVNQSVLTSGSITLPAKCLLICVIINAQAELTAASVGYSSSTDELMMIQDIPAGYFPLTKNIYFPQITTIFFNGITTQSVCSVIIAQF